MEVWHKVIKGQRQREPDSCLWLAVGLSKLVVLYQLVFIFYHVFCTVSDFYAGALFTAVARNETVAVVEPDYSKITVCTAALALNGS